MGAGADLSRQAILARLETSLLGRNLVFALELPSTNDEARRLADAGAPEGTVVIADHQTEGRGRQGRRWVSPPGSSLLFSIVFRPRLAPRHLQRLTMISGLAIMDALQEQTGLLVALKWPNDIVFGGDKMGGILAELQLSGDRVHYAIVGVGLNVNLVPEDLPAGLLVPATSLSDVLGRPVSRTMLLAAILRQLEVRYLDLQAGRVPLQEWAEHLATLGQPVCVATGSSKFSGVAETVADDGALLVRTTDGQLRVIRSGDVTLRHEASSQAP